MVIHKYILIGCIISTVPLFAYATENNAKSVHINEIAWMGTNNSANAEWIELANTSDKSIDLSKWTLTTLDGSPHIIFPSNTHISAHGYFLLERTSDKTVPGITADLIYKGSLSNSGETITLTNSASTTVDVVVSGKKWCAVGGNNVTKETAQRTDTGWITATSTPRATNATTGTVPTCTATQNNSGAGTAGTASSTSSTTTSTQSTTATTTSQRSTNGPPSFEPIPAVFLNIGHDRAIVAGADVRFSALVTDAAGKLYTRAIVKWTFGDGSAATGASVFKSYHMPGTYAVVVNAIQGIGSGEDDIIVTVRNANVTIPSVSKNGITLKNNTQYRLNISLWRLHAATTTFSFPDNTIILPHTSVIFPKEITYLPFTNNVTLLYPNGKEVVKYSTIKNVSKNIVLTKTKLFPSHKSFNYNRTQDIKKKDSNKIKEVKALNIISSKYSTSSYGNATAIAPAAATKIAAAGAHVVTATTTPMSYINRIFSSPLKTSLLSILIASTAVLVIL